MTDSENLLKAFHSFANLFEPIWFWKMDSAFHVLQSDCPHESLFRSLLLREGRREAIEAHICHHRSPGLLYGTLYAFLDHRLCTGGRENPQHLSGRTVFSGLQRPGEQCRPHGTDRPDAGGAGGFAGRPAEPCPVLSSKTLVQYAVILHYCIRQERLAPSEVVHYVARPKTRKHSKSVETNQFEKSSGRWRWSRIC